MTDARMACACIGPQNGEPLCPCRMRMTNTEPAFSGYEPPDQAILRIKQSVVPIMPINVVKGWMDCLEYIEARYTLTPKGESHD